MARKTSIFLTLMLFFLSVAARADGYGDARQQLVKAYQQQDFVAMELAARLALQHRPAYPAALYNLAYAQLLRGELEGSLQTLTQLANMNIDFVVDQNDAFVRLQTQPGWSEFASQIARIREPTGRAQVAFTMAQPDFVPEGIAISPNGDLLLGSIRYGTLNRVRPNGSVQLLSDGSTANHWSVFGISVVNATTAWFASSAVPQYIGYEDTEDGRSGLFRVSLDSGKITARALLPEDDRSHVLGDVIYDQGQRLYTSDSLSGEVLAYDLSTRAFEVIVEAGILVSPQGLALDKLGKRLYVADYNGGLFAIDLAGRVAHKVSASEALSLYGIDGLYRFKDQLIAIQNGVRPNRVISLTLSADGDAVIDHKILAMNLPEFDEPTLGVVQDDLFYFVANSHWNKFDTDNNLPGNLSGPIILRLELQGEAVEEEQP